MRARLGMRQPAFERLERDEEVAVRPVTGCPTDSAPTGQWPYDLCSSG